MALRKGIAANDGRCSTTGWRARHQAGHHAGPHHGCVQYGHFSHDLAKQRQRVVGGVAAGLGADIGKSTELRAVLLREVQCNLNCHQVCPDSAVHFIEPVAQLLLTLNTSTPDMPTA